jgi:uncharacterized protein
MHVNRFHFSRPMLSDYVITDPFFYVVSVPAVLLMGISKSGFGAGFGSLAVPLMALSVPVPQAASIMMPMLMVMDVLGVAAYRRDCDMKILKFLLPWGLAGIGLGFVTFRVLNVHWVSGLVGFFTLLFLAQRLLFPPQADSVAPPNWMGAILTTLAGFTSFIAHAGSAPINAYMLPMRLNPVKFAATMTVFFFVLNLAKWGPYAALGLLDWRNTGTAMVLMPLAPLGVWLGVRIARRIDMKLFYRFVYSGMFLTGIKLLWDGLA